MGRVRAGWEWDFWMSWQSSPLVRTDGCVHPRKRAAVTLISLGRSGLDCCYSRILCSCSVCIAASERAGSLRESLFETLAWSASGNFPLCSEITPGLS